MPVITTNNETPAVKQTPATTESNTPQPPSANLASLLGTDTAPIAAPADSTAPEVGSGDINDSSDALPPEMAGTTAAAAPAAGVTPPKAKRQPAVTLDPEAQAQRDSLLAQLKALDEAQKSQKQKELEDKKAAKEAEKAAKEDEKAKAKADAKAKREAEAKAKKEAEHAAIPVLAPVEVAPLPAGVTKTLEEGKASAALKAAFFAENNAELGYKKLAERYQYSIVPLVEDLVAEKVWPVKEDGSPWSYKKLYEKEKENGLKSWGHMVNRASERFGTLNPENIAKREKAIEEAKAKAKEEAALKAAGLAGKAEITVTPATKAVKGMDVSTMSQEDLFELAKACIMAFEAETADIFAVDPDIKLILRIDE